jgi:uncharacterized membrane protein YkvA (DUF1232 family)
MILSIALSVAASVLGLWLIFVVALLVMKPETAALRDAVRLGPDAVRLIHRLARDNTLRPGVRVRLGFLLAYLASPIDLVPDFIPVIGFADDVIVLGLVLRSVIKRAGIENVEAHWPGTPDGLATLLRVCRVPQIGPTTGTPCENDAMPNPPITMLTPDAKSRLMRAGYLLEGVTLGWNVIGIVVLTVAAIAARSVALAGFGLDSLIEIGASTVVLWELSGTGAERQHKALRLIGAAFIALAVYLAVQSTYVIATAHHAKHSALGIIWTAVTAAVMFGLATNKARVGRALDNPVLRTEGRVTMVDALLATAVLTGLALNAGLGWWWADPLAGYVIVFYGLREGIAALRTS